MLSAANGCIDLRWVSILPSRYRGDCEKAMPTNLSATAPLKTAIHIRPLENDPEMEAFADCRGKRIGVLIVAYNAVTTLALVLKRIKPQVWRNVEEVVVFEDASQDATY